MTASTEPPAIITPVSPFRVGNWQVDPGTARLVRDGKEIKLTPRAMEVLVFLAQRPGQLVTREDLEASVWAGTVVGYDALTSVMQKLRKALGDDSRSPQYIETLSKKGYRLVAEVQGIGSADITSKERATFSRLWMRHHVLLLAPLVATMVLVSLWWRMSADNRLDTAQISLAVLPFQNLSNDPKQSYFADGMAEDLITDLTKISRFFIISRDSSFQYREQGPDLRSVGEALNVRYVLHGSVRRHGDSIRINAQLSDAVLGKQLWAERYDGASNDVFRLQDEIARKIVAALSVTLTAAEQRNLARAQTSNIQAYEYYLQGEELFYRYSKTTSLQARQLFRQAISLDDHFASAYSMLAWTHVFDFMNGWSKVPQQSLKDSIALSSRALEIDSEQPLAYFVRGLAYREQGEYVKALVEAENAVRQDVNYANGHVLYATLLYYAGRPKEGLERMQKAVRLNPHHPYNYPFHLGQAYFILKQYNEAIREFERGLSSNPTSERLHVWLAAAYAQAGRVRDAQWEIEQVVHKNPEFSLERIKQAFPFKDPADLSHFINALRKAGAR